MNLLFAWRYFTSKKSTNAITLIAWISISAIVVGSAALIMVLSVFNGFEGLVKGLYADFYPDIKIKPSIGKTIHLSSHQIGQIQKTPSVLAFSLVAEEKAVLDASLQTIVTVKGVDEQYVKVNPINTPAHIPRGKFELGTPTEPKLVVGAGIENAAAIDLLSPFEMVSLYMPNRAASQRMLDDGLNAFQAVPIGSFSIQQDFDNQYVFTNLGFVKYMLGMEPDEFSSMEIKINGDGQAVKKILQKQLGPSFLIETRYEQNRSLYSVMQIEKWIIYAILSLILVIAAFNMIGALSMLVLEKKKDIAVLQALGASSQRIQQIFLMEGMLIAAIGAGIGILLATLICWLQMKFHLLKLGGNTFIVDYYPVQLHWQDDLLVLGTVLLIAFVAAWVPSKKAAAQPFSLKS